MDLEACTTASMCALLQHVCTGCCGLAFDLAHRDAHTAPVLCSSPFQVLEDYIILQQMDLADAPQQVHVS